MVMNKGTKTQNDLADFHIAVFNSVAAVYVVAPDILRREPQELAGVPFLFYYGRSFPVSELNDRAKEIFKDQKDERQRPHYFSSVESLLCHGITIKDYLVERNRLVGSDPKKNYRDIDLSTEIEIIPGKKIALEKLCLPSVPFSSLDHKNHYDDMLDQYDFKDVGRVRSAADYERMRTLILPDVCAERQFVKDQTERFEREAPFLFNRVLALAGLYPQKIQPYTPKVPVHESWNGK